jgi:hypothetical protein
MNEKDIYTSIRAEISEIQELLKNINDTLDRMIANRNKKQE